MKELIYEIILETINDFNDSLEQKIIVKDQDTQLYGNNAVLDSLSLVNFIVLLEENISEKFNKPITLTSEKAMSRKISPFLTLTTLTEYILDLLEEEK